MRNLSYIFSSADPTHFAVILMQLWLYYRSVLPACTWVELLPSLSVSLLHWTSGHWKSFPSVYIAHNSIENLFQRDRIIGTWVSPAIVSFALYRYYRVNKDC